MIGKSDLCVSGQRHDWRTNDRPSSGALFGSVTTVRYITWYCTRCRKVEIAEPADGVFVADLTPSVP